MNVAPVVDRSLTATLKRVLLFQNLSDVTKIYDPAHQDANFFEYAIIVDTWIPSRLTVSLLLLYKKRRKENVCKIDIKISKKLNAKFD